MGLLRATTARNVSLSTRGRQVLALLSQELEMALPTTALFDYPTIETLAYYISTVQVTAPSAQVAEAYSAIAEVQPF